MESFLSLMGPSSVFVPSIVQSFSIPWTSFGIMEGAPRSPFVVVCLQQHVLDLNWGLPSEEAIKSTTLKRIHGLVNKENKIKNTPSLVHFLNSGAPNLHFCNALMTSFL